MNYGENRPMESPPDPDGLQDPYGLLASGLWNTPDDSDLSDPSGLSASGLPPWTATPQAAIAHALFDQKITTLAEQLDLHPQVLTNALQGVPPAHWQPIVDALMLHQQKEPQPILGVAGMI